MIVDGISFDEFTITSVTMDLQTLSLTFNVIFHKEKKRVVRIKEYRFPSDGNVDINEKIKELENIILNG